MVRDPELIRAVAADMLRTHVGQRRFPWYDSVWLEAYCCAVDHFEQEHSDKVGVFDELIAPFRTPPDFEVRLLRGFIRQSQLDSLRAEVRAVIDEPVSIYERERFGRDLFHNRPLFSELQDELSAAVGLLVGEPIESCYNFLSLYGPDGVCEPHMDTPQAKWTLDICIDQSVAWPLHISPVTPWPVDWVRDHTRPWQDQIIEAHGFEPYVMEPGDAILFSGSSQWHYRTPMPSLEQSDFCHLLFLHYVPTGMGERCEPDRWAELVGAPSLQPLMVPLTASQESVARGFHWSRQAD